MEWISVKDKLPPESEYVLAVTKRHGVKMGIALGYKKPSIHSYPNEHQITHWMPLPEPPEGD